MINFNDFSKLDLRIAQVKQAEEVNASKKLLKITLDVGDLGEKIIISGIKEWYQPKDLIGKSILYLANLRPKEIFGLKSEGMILAAGDQKAVVLIPDGPIKAGEKVR